MEFLALLFALSPIIVTLIVWVYNENVRASEKKATLTLHQHQEIPIVQVAPVAVTASPAKTSSGDDEIAVVLAAAAAIYVKTTTT